MTKCSKWTTRTGRSWSILRADARTPVAVLAQKLRIARGTVQNRLRKLEHSGVITGYTVRLRPSQSRSASAPG